MTTILVRHTSKAISALWGGAVPFAQVRPRSNKAIRAARERNKAGLPPIDEWAYNYIEKKDGLFKPPHTVQEQIDYMNSDIFTETYKGQPVFRWYVRNSPSQYMYQSKPRLYCIDKHGRFNLNHACPICRDEYLFFDYRNPKLIEMFLTPGTDNPLAIRTVGLCQEQYLLLKVQLLKAKEHGSIVFPLEFRRFNYRNWYPSWQPTDEENISVIDPKTFSRLKITVEDVLDEPDVVFETHNRDTNTNWDEWWLRHKKFAKTVK